jgi:putative ABC transport system permease protein
MLQDLRYAVRSLFRQPTFAATAILTLALGIGATTAIFSVVNAVVLRPLPFERPERIVGITNYWTRTGQRGSTVSGPDFHDWEAQSRSFEAMAYYAGGETSVTVNGAADYANAYRVTPRFFDVLHARPALGRLWTATEEAPAVVVSDAFWRKQFGGNPAAVGSTIKFDDQVYTIVGILPPGIRYPIRTDIYFPALRERETKSRSGHNYRVIARLRDGIALEQASGEMTAIATALAREYPNSNEGKLTAVVPLLDLVVGGTRQILLVLLGAVGLVLLIACANVANLLLARATVRTREMLVRAAVGASRGRLVRQLLVESAVLGVAAALLGAWLAQLGVFGLLALAPSNLPRVGEVQVDVVALLFTLGVALLSSGVFGLAPALHVSRVRLGDGLRQGGKGSNVGGRSGWARSAFVVIELAFAVVLVAGAGLLARSLAQRAAVDLGFSPERLLVLQTEFPVRTFQEAPRATDFYRDLLGELRSMPGVAAIGGVTSLPTLVRSNGGYWIEGGATMEQTGVRAPQALFNVVTPDYFRALRVAVTPGRDFNDGDRRGAPLVAIVNESLARAAFPGADPLGRRIQCGLDMLDFMTIVGVVADVRTDGPTAPAQPELFMPYEQHPGPATALNLVARTDVENPLALAETMRRAIARRNPDVPVKPTTMTGTLASASAAPRFQTYLISVFGAVALLLAFFGVYGVMAYTVSQRLPELAVRVALGAAPEQIMHLVLASGARLAAAGLVLGLALALAFGRLLEQMLFGVTSRDPFVLTAVVAVVAAAALAACYVPGRRAVRVDPMSALRAE